MRIDIEDWDGQTKYAHYHYFSIGGPEHDYSLKAYSYSGTSGTIYLLCSVYQGLWFCVLCVYSFRSGIFMLI